MAQTRPSKRTNYTGQRFGKLTALRQGPDIVSGTIPKRRTTWILRCDCGNEITATTSNLSTGSTTSCGCLVGKFGTAIKPGTIFGRLTTISYLKGFWTCLCECGNTTIVKTEKLTNGNNRSCGCLVIDTNKDPDKVNKLISGQRKREPRLSSAHRVWENYTCRDDRCLVFDDFLIISQFACVYCDAAPFKINNPYRKASAAYDKPHNGSIEDADFTYNGLDRIDSNGHHTIDNVVPCCIYCNRAKNDQPLQNFLDQVARFQIKEFPPIDMTKVAMLDFPGKYKGSSVKVIFKPYAKDSDLTKEEFYSLSQLPCSYCLNEPVSCCNTCAYDKRFSQEAVELAEYHYNGLDRLDSNRGHTKDNIVPCCYFCNWAKGKRTVEEFVGWMAKIQAFQKEHPFDFAAFQADLPEALKKSIAAQSNHNTIAITA